MAPAVSSTINARRRLIRSVRFNTMPPIVIKLGVIDKILEGLPTNPSLRAEVAKLREQIEILLSENAMLLAKNTDLSLQIEKFKHPSDISEVGNNILQHLAAKGPCCGVSDLTSLLGLPFEDVKVHCDDLRNRGLVSGQPNLSHFDDDWQPTFCITDKGEIAAMRLRQ